MKRTSNLEQLAKLVNYDFIFENKFIIAGLILGLILLIIGIAQLFLQTGDSNQIEIVPASQSEINSGQTGEIVIDISGAVGKPGVYGLPQDSRIAKAVEVAGNFSSSADLSWVAKNLNLAAILQDGAKIYIPAKGEQSTVGIQGTRQLSNTVKVNINTADQSQLEALPAIGPVTAGKIISARPYNSVEDLLTKKVVGKSTFAKIKDLVSVF